MDRQSWQAGKCVRELHKMGFYNTEYEDYVKNYEEPIRQSQAQEDILSPIKTIGRDRNYLSIVEKWAAILGAYTRDTRSDKDARKTIPRLKEEIYKAGKEIKDNSKRT